jgi:hypothetical protein
MPIGIREFATILAVLFMVFSCGKQNSGHLGDTDEQAPTEEIEVELEPDVPEELPEVEEQTEPEPDVPPAQSFIDAIDQVRFTEELTFVAQVRTPGSAHWQAVQDRCFQRFTEYGYDTRLHEYETGVNVIGVKQGLQPEAPQVIISAHYDHIAECQGADDNASGVAALFEAARVLADAQFTNTLIVACWDEEEDGLIGSKAYATQADGDGDEILAAFVFETIAYTSTEPNSQTMPPGFEIFFPELQLWLEQREFVGDFLSLVADESARDAIDALVYWAEAVELPLALVELTERRKNSILFADMRRSDHAAFWEYDQPALMLTDSANFRNPHYHCADGQDSIDTLDIPFAIKVTKACVGAAVDLLELLEGE